MTWTGDVSYVYSPDLALTLRASVAADAFIAGDEVRVSVSGTDAVDAGTYTATAVLTGAKAGNYRLTGATQNYTIAKAPATAIEVAIDYAGETLGTTTELEYSVDGGATWTACTANMAITEAMIGASLLLRRDPSNY